LQSFVDYEVGTPWNHDHIIVLDTDEVLKTYLKVQARFGGQERLRIGHKKYFSAVQGQFNGRPYHFKIYIPARTAVVLTPIKKFYEEQIKQQ